MKSNLGKGLLGVGYLTGLSDIGSLTGTKMIVSCPGKVSLDHTLPELLMPFQREK